MKPYVFLPHIFTFIRVQIIDQGKAEARRNWKRKESFYHFISLTRSQSNHLLTAAPSSSSDKLQLKMQRERETDQPWDFYSCSKTSKSNLVFTPRPHLHQFSILIALSLSLEVCRPKNNWPNFNLFKLENGSIIFAQASWLVTGRNQRIFYFFWDGKGSVSNQYNKYHVPLHA